MDWKKLIFLLLFLLIGAACNLPRTDAQAPATVVPSVTPSPSRLPTRLPTGTVTPSQTPVPSDTPPPTFTRTPTHTRTVTRTPTITDTPTGTASPTFAFPVVTVNQQSHCRYGPAKAYLHAADLYAGDTGTVGGRFQMSGWLYVKFEKLHYYCWVAPSVVDVDGDITTIRYAAVNLPGPSVLYAPPGNVTAVRDGDAVTITWRKVDMTEDDDRGYFLDLMVCQGGHYLWWPVSLGNDDTTSYVVEDQEGCAHPSGGKLYAVEKHGYTTPVDVPWPAP
ncbi:MAG: hypothetical protein ACOYYS_17105 [Chloroflexota bacterium]